MSTNYTPTERCTIDQALKNAELQGIEVNLKDASDGTYWFTAFGSSAFISVEDGWVRGGARFGGNENVELILSHVTNIWDWVDENQDEYEFYSLWTDEERLVHAESWAESIIENLEGERKWAIAHNEPSEEIPTLEDATADVLQSMRGQYKELKIPTELPLATPFTDN